MIKRASISFLIMAIMLLCPVVAHAQNTVIEECGNGYYYETIIDVVDETIAVEEDQQSERAEKKTLTGTKTVNYRNSAGSIVWYVKVTGTFTYGNGTAICTSSSVTAESMHSTWKIISKSASKTGNKAKATATARHYNNGTPAETITKAVILTCSSNGTLS